MKSAMLLSQTEALEEEPDATEQERDVLEVDCGAKPLALHFLILFQVLELSNIYTTSYQAFYHVVSYTSLVPTSHNAAAQGSREPCAHESQRVGERSRIGIPRFCHAILMQFTGDLKQGR